MKLKNKIKVIAHNDVSNESELILFLIFLQKKENIAVDVNIMYVMIGLMPEAVINIPDIIVITGLNINGYFVMKSPSSILLNITSVFPVKKIFLISKKKSIPAK